MKTPGFLTFALWGFTRLICPAQDSFIWINVSVKCIVSPGDGLVPASMNDPVLHDTFRDINRWLAVNWRGFRVRLVDLNANNTFKRIGFAGDTTGPGKWYNVDLKDENSPANGQFEDAARANKSAFGWNDNAVNIYFNNSAWSRANFPSSGRALVISGYSIFLYDLEPGQTTSASYKIAGNLLHEIGHFFELYHTHGGIGTGANDDAIADTALDAPSPDDQAARDEPAIRDILAQLNYAKNYSALTVMQKLLVDNSANNAMAYHQLFYDNPATGKVVSDAERFGNTRFVFTEQQMDKWTDYANSQRLYANSGRTWFVDAGVAISGAGTSSSPVKTLTAGINAASTSDIVLLRPGNYVSSVLDKPLTIRATRQGPAVIRKP